MTAYEIVKVTPDTPEWERERRNSVGASEVAAIMGLSSYGNTALDVYKHKQGIDRHFDPLLAWIGHQSEPIIEAWVHELSGIDVALQPGFMARSVDHPYLHASFDRVSGSPFLTWQFKTAHHYSGHHWDEGIPTDIRVQVQAEMAVAGTRRAAVVVWIGGREFRLFWEPRDDRFIDEHLIPTVREFWDANVRAQVPPPVSSVAEVNALPTDTVETELSREAFDVLERITVLNSDIDAQSKERDALKVALAQYTGTADTLTFEGRKVATWRQQKGRVGFDKEGLRADHPNLIAKYTTQGAPFRVLRRTKEQSK
ncbi:phage-type endonuclease [Microbacterium laevaniformans OR221]|nr:phage-type endonuclease [Microbacterium laevaniformans OR221]